MGDVEGGERFICGEGKTEGVRARDGCSNDNKEKLLKDLSEPTLEASKDGNGRATRWVEPRNSSYV